MYWIYFFCRARNYVVYIATESPFHAGSKILNTHHWLWKTNMFDA